MPIRRSVTPEYIICLEDGKKLKMLKRHLRTTYNMTPEEYRAKWNLSPDYPMVAPNYAQQRSDFAKQIGLGRKPGEKRRGRKRTPPRLIVPFAAPIEKGRPWAAFCVVKSPPNAAGKGVAHQIPR